MNPEEIDFAHLPTTKTLPRCNFAEIEADLAAQGHRTAPYVINPQSFERYFLHSDYPDSYVRAIEKKRPGRFRAKALEHYISGTLLDLRQGEVYLDIASMRSPYPSIARTSHPSIQVYTLDVAYESGIHGTQIGADATHTGLPDEFCDKASLHCAYEMFLGEDDRRLIPELFRILKPGGRAVIIPLYMNHVGYLRINPDQPPKKSPVPGKNEKLFRGKSASIRVYSPDTLKERVLDAASGCGFATTILRIANLAAVTDQLDSPMILVLEKGRPAIGKREEVP